MIDIGVLYMYVAVMPHFYTHLTKLKNLMKLFVSNASTTFTAKTTREEWLMAGEYS